jgi:hypothetical protein
MKPIIYAVVFILAMFITFWLTFGRNTYFTKIDTQFSEAGIPLVKASIQNKIFYLKFDLGSKFQITLPKDILTNLKKKKLDCYLVEICMETPIKHQPIFFQKYP